MIKSETSQGVKANMMSFLLAPMAELSHRALRELIEGFGGCDEYFTEMISAPALFGGGPFERWYLDGGPCPEKTVYQLVGADMGQISRAATLLNGLECKGIDLNMGCCAPLIRKTGAGIAWMASVDRAGELAKEVRKAVKRRLSVKIRIGFADDFEYLVRFCRRLEEEGVDLITLHPRTAKEKLKRLARWDYVGALRRELNIPIAGNGDIADAEGLLARAGGECDAVMVGRAAVRQPWIFAEAKKNLPRSTRSFTEARGGLEEFSHKGTEVRRHKEGFLEETGLRFLELLGHWQPPEFHISRARRFFGFFCDNLQWGTHVKNLLNREETLSGIERAWREYFKTTTL
ncbi:MAG: tRNA-dihydrouridine synthase family protein [Treponema sp.]|jgi:tRNA-dihydrouridine synthase|nr:tRNA-dihydrouridine synthase family protein [Treponema sp.]